MLSILIDTHFLMAARKYEVERFFHSFSAASIMAVCSIPPMTVRNSFHWHSKKRTHTTLWQSANIVEDIAGIKAEPERQLDAPKGVNDRNSDNTLIQKSLFWGPSITLRAGRKRLTPRYTTNIG
jgi:hypothetical protein